MDSELGFNVFYDSPVAEGTMRVLCCTVCGAIIYLAFPSGRSIGDPDLHADWHQKNGI